jgi:hypothetical protein
MIAGFTLQIAWTRPECGLRPQDPGAVSSDHHSPAKYLSEQDNCTWHLACQVLESFYFEENETLR